jgi:transcriptional regulator with XRE-family HTH domain
VTAPSLPWSTCKSLARATWTRARALAHKTREHAAEATGIDRSHLSRWESEKCDHPAPLAALWSVALVPDEELDALIAQLRADRAAQRERDVLATPEGSLAASMQQATAMLSGGIGALSDGRVSADERHALRPELAALMTTLRRTLRAWDAADATPDRVVPMRRAGGAR